MKKAFKYPIDVEEDALDTKKTDGPFKQSDWKALIKVLDAVAKNDINHQLRDVARDLEWKVKNEYHIFACAVKTAMVKKNKPFSGGRDIMKNLVKKLREDQGLPTPKRKPGYFSDGFGIIQKLVNHTPPEQAEGIGEGYDVMQQLKRHPVKVKKSMEPLEIYPQR